MLIAFMEAFGFADLFSLLLFSPGTARVRVFLAETQNFIYCFLHICMCDY